MPRNGSGSYSLPEPAFVPQTPISSAAVNSDFSDIGAALTASLARDGQGGMTAVLPLAGAGLNYTVDPNTGIHRIGGDTQAIFCGGTDVVTVSTTGASVTGSLDATTLKQNGLPILPIGLGPLPWSGRTAPPLWLLATGGTFLRASYPDLWTFAQAEIAAGNTLYNNGNGSTTFGIADVRGRVVGAPDGSTPGFVHPGSTAGAFSVLIGVNNLPNTTFPFSAPVTVNSTLSNFLNGASAGNFQIGGSTNGPFTMLATSSSFNTVQSTGTVTGSASSNGSGNGLSVVQPVIAANFIIYAGA